MTQANAQSLIAALERELAACQKENARLRPPPDEARSEHPGCVDALIEDIKSQLHADAKDNCHEIVMAVAWMRNEIDVVRGKLVAAQARIKEMTEIGIEIQNERLARFEQAEKEGLPEEPWRVERLDFKPSSQAHPQIMVVPASYADKLRAYAIVKTARVKNLEEELEKAVRSINVALQGAGAVIDAQLKAESERDAARRDERIYAKGLQLIVDKQRSHAGVYFSSKRYCEDSDECGLCIARKLLTSDDALIRNLADEPKKEG